MHEMSIAQSLLEIVQTEIEKNNLEKLLKVKVHLGQINAVIPDALQMAFNVLISEDSRLSQANLEIETIPLKLSCSSCKHVFTAESNQDHLFFSFPCPNCGQDFGHEVLAGKELNIEYLEAE